MEEITFRFTKNVLLLFLITLEFSLSSFGLSIVGQSCTLSDSRGSEGICTNFNDCQAAISNLRSGISPTVCARLKNVAIICCPVGKSISAKKCEEYSEILVEKQSFPLLPITQLETYSNITDSKKCSVKAIGYIVGGRDAQPEEFPHMVALGYGINKHLTWRCGATLISDEYVLTAAHCLDSLKHGLPTAVLLGDIGLTKKVSSDRTVIGVSSVIVHPDRKSPLSYNDIGLVKLARKVQLSKAIRPACLPDPEQRLEIQSNVSTVGWGQLEFAGAVSEILQAVKLNRFGQNECSSFFAEQPARFIKYPQGIKRSQICAGDKKGEKDSCNGDSGGPLTVTAGKQDCIFYVIGVTSFGSRYCGSGEPAVYTNVQSYLYWIENIVWESDVYDYY